MKVINKVFDIDIPSVLNLIDKEDKFLFFDIETTGFSPKNSSLYLIGFAFIDKNKKLNFTQYFSLSYEDEKEALTRFFKVCKNFSYLVSFNGETFDNRYLLDLTKKYKINSSFTQLINLDLYKIIKKYKKHLKLDTLKQKELEKFFLKDIREDIFTGGELIQIYKAYLINKDEKLLYPLLLHNEEDILGLFKLSILLNFKYFFSSTFDLEKMNTNENSIDINLVSKFSLPIKIEYEDFFLKFLAYKKNIHISLKIIDTELKYFLPNYKDYFYIKREDICIHKSLATFTLHKEKEKAKKETAFVKKKDKFLNFYNSNYPTIFKKNYSDKNFFIPLSEFNKNMLFDLTKNIFLYLNLLK